MRAQLLTPSMFLWPSNKPCACFPFALPCACTSSARSVLGGPAAACWQPHAAAAFILQFHLILASSFGLTPCSFHCCYGKQFTEMEMGLSSFSWERLNLSTDKYKHFCQHAVSSLRRAALAGSKCNHFWCICLKVQPLVTRFQTKSC